MHKLFILATEITDRVLQEYLLRFALVLAFLCVGWGIMLVRRIAERLRRRRTIHDQQRTTYSIQVEGNDMSQGSLTDQQLVRQWWISTEGTAQGPYTEGYVIAALATRTIPASALACPVGAQGWKRVCEWPEFAGAALDLRQTDSATPSPVATGTGMSAPVLTNPLLPPMANWICVYAIAVAPLLSAFYCLSCCVTFNPMFREDSPFLVLEFVLSIVDRLFDLGITALVMVGGFRLKGLRRSGIALIKTGVWITVGWVVLFTMAYLTLAIAGGVSGEELFSDRTTTTAQDLISFTGAILGLVQLIFCIVALVWLHRHGKSVPLSDS